MPELIFGDNGDLGIPYLSVSPSRYEDRGEALRTGIEGQRQDVLGSVTVKYEDFSGGGLVSASRVHSWLDSLNLYGYNEGLQTHIFGGLYMPYELQTQTSLTDDVDISGYRAANLRAHGFQTNAGQSKLRAGIATGPRIYVTTDDSTHTMLEVTGAGLTNSILCAKEITAGGSKGMAFCTNGQTDDAFFVTDISADPLTLTTKLFTYPHANDRVWAIEHLPQYGYVVFYGIYNNTGPGWFGFPDSDSLPVTPKRLIRTTGRTLPNANNATESVTVQAVAHVNKSAGDIGFDMSTLVNVGASDNSDVASLSAWAAGETTHYLVCTYPSLSIPPSTPTGMLFSPELSEGATGDNIYWGTAASGANDDGLWIVINDVIQSAYVYNPATTEIATTDTSYPVGSSTQLLAPVTYEDLNSGFGCALRWFADGAATNPNIALDAVPLTITYRPHGTAETLPGGGWSRGRLPSNPDVIPLVLPLTTEAATVNQPRQLWYSTFTFHADENRLTVETNPVTTNMAHVEAYAEFLDGVMVAGDTKSGVAKSLRFVNGNGEIRNLSLPTTHGGNAWGVVSMHPHGDTMILDMAYEDGTNAQWMYWIDSTFHNSTPLQSKEASIAALPLGWTTTILGSELRRLYRVFPNGTDTAISRIFIPRNLFDDPLLANTTETKHDGPLFLRTVETDYGAEEMNKVLTGVTFIGRQISATASTYGTVKIEFERGGDTSFASPAVTTGNLAASFLASSAGEYLVPSGGEEYRDGIVKITLNNAGSSSTKTPNGLAFLLHMTADPRPLDRYTFVVDGKAAAEKYQSWAHMLNLLDTLTNTKGLQKLAFADITPVLARFSGWPGQFRAVNLGEPLIDLAEENPTLVFDTKRGKVTA